MAGLEVQLSPEQLGELAEAVAARLAARLDAQAAPPGWLTTREAAAHLGMHVNEVQRAAAAGAIPHEQDAPGCALRFRVEELDAWVRKGSRDALAEGEQPAARLMSAL